MTIKNWLVSSQNILHKAAISSDRLDCLILLEDATQKDRAWLLAHPEVELAELGAIGPTYHKLQSQIERRARHEPLAYIRSKTEFYGREFMVNNHTLEPRPETETMIELFLNLAKDSGLGTRDFTVVDVGTGSGAIAITAKLELPDATVYATDIDKKCIETAKQNAGKLTADVTFLQGNLLEPILSTTYHLPPTKLVILANLPYVPDSHTINQAAMFEPRHAIFGGVDGLDLYREMFTQLTNLKSKVHNPKAIQIFTESLPFQHTELATIAKSHGFKLHKTEDLIQVFTTNNNN
jgi:release factor glutamine methyltransferase